jgi:hypothetical protein
MNNQKRAAIRHSPSAIRHSPFAIRHSPFAIRHSPFAIRHSPFAIRHSLSAICYLPLSRRLHRSPRGHPATDHLARCRLHEHDGRLG